MPTHPSWGILVHLIFNSVDSPGATAFGLWFVFAKSCCCILDLSFNSLMFTAVHVTAPTVTVINKTARVAPIGNSRLVEVFTHSPKSISPHKCTKQLLIITVVVYCMIIIIHLLCLFGT